MREEIYKLSLENKHLKYKDFKKFKMEKGFEIKSVFTKPQIVLFSIVILIMCIIEIFLIRIKTPMVFPALLMLLIAYCIISIFDSILKIKVNVKDKKIIIKKINKKYVIPFENINRLYLVTNDKLQGIKAKIRILYKESKSRKIKNLTLDTSLLKTKDIKKLITQIETEKLTDSEKKGEFSKEEIVDETIASNIELVLMIILGIIILIDFAI